MSDDLVLVGAFREAFRNSKHIIVVAGAGLSAASGKFLFGYSKLGLNVDQASLPFAMVVACGGRLMPFPSQLPRHSPRIHRWFGSFITTAGPSVELHFSVGNLI